MAQRVRISCINKDDRFNPYERITHIGGLNADNTRWKLELSKAIAGIKAGTWVFYVRVGQHDVDVVIATSRFGNEYLRTTADSDTPDNLLSLPECP